MTTIANTLRHAAEQLAAISDTARLDAELLMAHALNMERGAMLLHKMHDPAPALFGPLLLRRLAHEPIAYIIGKAEFWSLTLNVTPDVLIPRGDSETLIEAALAECKAQAPATILDLGTGSGALICAALSEWPDAKGVAIDASEQALHIAEQNITNLGFADRCQTQHQSWRTAHWQDKHNNRYDLILCNPPYVESAAELASEVRDFEPGSALFAGPEGMDDYAILIPQIADMLTPYGIAIFEIGRGQLDAVGNMAKQVGLSWSAYNDLANIPRAIVMRA
ncbi:peptide chain release factor N(5)-glutamine methyltransferase [Parasphingorhabdus sp. DH2-15]|uniref:peptide chain release factor N(5)-glutamine methyltransferase n=1 Tax=Parasphingorhabdus sp. DH2-15 TaxID=3444112 RepID=UPI003F683391